MSRIIPAFMQFFDDNGDPLVNGWLRFTVSGTNNTDKATYADSSETIANTNPLQLDGAGRCPNVFGSGSYNVRSYTDNAGSPGVQIQQFDPVGGADAGGQFSEWLSATIYGVGDIVIGPDDKYYRSLVTSNQNNDPTVSPQQWEEVQLVGAYNQYVTYAAGEIALDTDGYLYRSLQSSNLNNTPSSNLDWWGPAVLQTDLVASVITHNMTSDADYTLTTAENRNGRVIITDTGVIITTGRNIIVSTTQRVFIAQNDTAQILTFKTAAGTGIPVAAGDYAILVCDGTNIEYIASSASETQKGLVERATQAEVDTGTDIERFVTPATLSNYSNMGKLALIDSWVPTAVNSKDFTWDESLYSDIRIVIEGVIPATDDSHLYLRLGYNNGGSFYSGTGDYRYVIEAQDPAAGTYVQAATYVNTYLPISCGVAAGVAYTDTQSGVGSAAGEGYSGTIELLGMASPVSYPRAHCDFSYVDDIGQYQWGVMDGVVADATADTTQLDSARIYWEAGNFEVAGKIWVYGLLRT